MRVLLGMRGWVDWCEVCFFSTPTQPEKRESGSRRQQSSGGERMLFLRRKEVQQQQKKGKCAFSLFSFFLSHHLLKGMVRSQLTPHSGLLHRREGHSFEKRKSLSPPNKELQERLTFVLPQSHNRPPPTTPPRHLVTEEQNLGDKASVVTRGCSKELWTGKLLEAAKTRL